MSRFVKVPALNIGDKSDWVLAGEMVYYSSLLENLIFIPPQFETDLASIPRVFRFIFNRNGKSRKAAIVHDYLYSVRGKIRNNGFVDSISRATADKIFLEAMEVCGVGYFSRKTMYAGVRAGGWTFWR